MPFSLTPELFLTLSALVEERMGLHYGREEETIFAHKVEARARDAGFETALDYYYFLRYDPAAPAELEALADALVVTETYFFRELEALRTAAKLLIAPAIAARGKAHIWSAGCATGEEPLSLAMVLEEMGLRRQCRIVATDVSARALSRAREGSYRDRSLRMLPPHPPPPVGFTPGLAAISAASLTRKAEAPGQTQASRTLLDMIDYRQLNLLEPALIPGMGAFDLILCRNVLIYFADDTVKRVVNTLADALRRDGRLLIGASESLLRFGTALRSEERGGTFFYAKESA